MTTTAGKQHACDQFRWLRQVAFDHELPPNAAGIAIALTQFFNPAGECWPAQETMAELLGYTSRHVRSGLAAMVARGHLTVVGQGKGGRQVTNRYRLRLRPLATGDTGTRFPGLEPETRNQNVGNPEIFCRKPGSRFPTNPSRTHLEPLADQPNTAGSLASGPDDSPLTRPPLTDTEASKKADDREAQLREWIALATMPDRVPKARPPRQAIRKPAEDLNGALANLEAGVRGDPVNDEPRECLQSRRNAA